MRLSEQITYPDGDLTSVFAMLSSQAFHEHKCAASGATSFEVEVTPGADDTLSVITHRDMPADQIPDFLKSFVGPSLRITERTAWQAASGDGSRTGTISVQIAGTPVSFSGKTRLAASGSGVVESVDGDLKASVPLIGGKVEKAAAPAVQAAVRVEERTGRAWLAGEFA